MTHSAAKQLSSGCYGYLKLKNFYLIVFLSSYDETTAP